MARPPVGEARGGLATTGCWRLVGHWLLSWGSTAADGRGGLADEAGGLAGVRGETGPETMKAVILARGFGTRLSEETRCPDGDEMVWEREPIERIAQAGELMGYRHYGFWSCMDTLKEKNMLEELWASGKAPWRISGETHGAQACEWAEWAARSTDANSGSQYR